MNLPHSNEMASAQAGDAAHLRLIVLSDAAPSRNGVGAYYQDLQEQLSGRVADIRLVSPTIDDNGRWRAGLVLPMPGDKTQRLCLPNIWKLNRLFKEVRPDAVIAATPGAYGIVGAWLARRKGIPFLTGFHTSFEQLTDLYWAGTLRGRIIAWYFRRSNGYLLKRTHAVLANSEPVLEQARALGASRLRLIGTPVSAQFLRCPLAPYLGGFEKLLFAGRLAREKNIDAILEAARALPELRFTLCGDGPLREQVEAGAASLPNLEYRGWLSREELRRAVDEHDALLLPSYFETFGTIALEAMARERLVVVSEGCGISRWEELNHALFVLPPDRPLAELLRLIRAMAPEERCRMADGARRSASRINGEVVEDWCRLLLETVTDDSR